MKQTSTSLMNMGNGTGTLINTRWPENDHISNLMMEQAAQCPEQADFILREYGIPMDKVKRVTIEREK